MKRKKWITLAALIVCLCLTIPALATVAKQDASKQIHSMDLQVDSTRVVYATGDGVGTPFIASTASLGETADTYASSTCRGVDTWGSTPDLTTSAEMVVIKIPMTDDGDKGCIYSG